MKILISFFGFLFTFNAFGQTLKPKFPEPAFPQAIIDSLKNHLVFEKTGNYKMPIFELDSRNMAKMPLMPLDNNQYAMPIKKLGQKK